MPDSGIAREVSLGGIDLKIKGGKNGELQYQEKAIAGGDITDERAAIHFSDEFTSWHKGAFVKENVQDGYYYLSCNVDASYPGRIFPGPRRRENLRLPAPTHANGYGPVAGIAPTPFIEMANNNYAITVVYEKKNSGSTFPTDKVAIFELNQNGEASVDQRFNLETNRVHFNYLRPMFLKKYWHVPLMEAGYARREETDATPWVQRGNTAGDRIAVWAFGSGVDRVYRAYYPSVTETPVVTLSDLQLYFSNAAIDADLTKVASWTNPGDIIPGVLSGNFEMVQIAMIGRNPYIATRQGVHAIGRSGWAESLFPQFQESPSNSYDFKAYRNYNSMIIAGTANGQAVMFTGGDAVPIGPMVNPAARFTNSNAPSFLDFWPMSSGRIYASTTDGDTYNIWCGVPRTPGESGPGAFAWHTLICIPVETTNPPTNQYADVITSNNFTMTRPISVVNFSPGWPFDSASTDLWFGAGRADAGKIFNWHLGNWGDLEAGEYPHEESEHAVGTDNIYFRTGRYNRGQKRSKKHWIQVVFDGENISVTNHILVDASVDGGAFTQVGDITTDHTAIPIDVQGYDIELRLRWKPSGIAKVISTVALSNPGIVTTSTPHGFSNGDQVRIEGVAGVVPFGGVNGPTHTITVTGASTFTIPVNVTTGGTGGVAVKTTGAVNLPATIKRIIFEGREQPQKLVAITFVAEATNVGFVGAVRKKLFGSDMHNTVNALARGLKQTFRDPFKNNRTVVVLHPTEQNQFFGDGEQPPKNSIVVNLLEVP